MGFQYENNEPCGYLVFGNGWPILKIYQCCIQVDARRAHQAAILIKALIETAQKWRCSSISLWCAEDLDSNSFWRAMRFKQVGQRDVQNKRGRKHNGWVYWLSDLFEPSVDEISTISETGMAKLLAGTENEISRSQCSRMLPAS